MFQDFFRATTIDEALTTMERATKPYRVIAGGTDLLLQAQQGKGYGPVSLISISDVSELAGIEVSPEGLRIGAATKLADIERSNLFKRWTASADARS